MRAILGSLAIIGFVTVLSAMQEPVARTAAHPDFSLVPAKGILERQGVKLQGVITWFDSFSLLLRRDAAVFSGIRL